MYIVDAVNGEKFRSICDFEFGQEVPDKENPLMYAESDNYIKAINFIQSRSDRNFRLLTHNSDVIIDKCEVPENLVSWHAQNLNFTHHKVFSLPIGLENPHWHPMKVSVMQNSEDVKDRLIKAVGQFNPMTFYEERYNLLEMATSGRVYADCKSAINGFQFDNYVSSLRKYAFCLCPRGNGIDTHRVWEALYLGCIPIVKNYITHSCLSDMPILFIDDWSEVTEDRLQTEYDRINKIVFSYEELQFSYWKKRILQ
jgi:hypothetical protein|tara:strand:- start:2500 stop:3264 length:765 start_codon:yes stop_codon:yes gene_type:complete